MLRKSEGSVGKSFARAVDTATWKFSFGLFQVSVYVIPLGSVPSLAKSLGSAKKAPMKPAAINALSPKSVSTKGASTTCPLPLDRGVLATSFAKCTGLCVRRNLHNSALRRAFASCSRTSIQPGPSTSGSSRPLSRPCGCAALFTTFFSRLARAFAAAAEPRK